MPYALSPTPVKPINKRNLHALFLSTRALSSPSSAKPLYPNFSRSGLCELRLGATPHLPGLEAFADSGSELLKRLGGAKAPRPEATEIGSSGKRQGKKPKWQRPRQAVLYLFLAQNMTFYRYRNNHRCGGSANCASEGAPTAHFLASNETSEKSSGSLPV